MTEFDTKEDGPLEKILLVDDFVPDAALISKLYRADWIHVRNLAEAIDALFDPDAFTVIVCDPNLSDGHSPSEVVSAIRFVAPKVPLIAFSGFDSEEVVKAVSSAGADAFLAKDQLNAKIIGQVIAHALGKNPRPRRISTGGKHPLQIELEAQVRENNRIFSWLQNGSLDGLWYWDVTSDDEWYSDRFGELLGYEPHEIKHVAGWWQEMIFPEDLNLAFDNYRKHLEDESHPYDQIVRYRHRDGSTVWIRCRGLLIRDQAGNPWRLLGAHTDVTALKEAELRLRESSRQNDVTGIPNKLALRSRFEEMVRRAERGRPFALAYFDMDGLKRINDGLAHSAGDAAIATIGARAQKAVRKSIDHVFHLHGDEFAVLADGVKSAAEAEGFGERLIEQVCTRPIRYKDQNLPAGITVGVALYPEHGRTFETLLDAADRAMLAAKRDGKRCVRVSSPDDPASSGASQFEIERDVAGALERGEIWVAFQPQCRLADNQVVGYEALMRWDRRPSQPRCGPDLFIPALAQTHRLAAATRLVLREACRVITETGRRVAVNVTPAQLQSAALATPPLIRDIANVIETSGVHPGLLEIEITEERIPDGDESVLQAIHAVRALGVGVALDDFGKGQATFQRLEMLPLTKLKLDKDLSFSDGTIVRWVKAIASVAGDYGVQLVAEGIETEAQRDALVDVGVEFGQGWLLGRPGPL